MDEDSMDYFFPTTSLPMAMAAFNDTFENHDVTVMDPILGSSSSGGNETSLGWGCGASLKTFETRYKHVHGYISLIVCLFGAQANVLNLIILTKLINPTNAILTGLALSDLVVMCEYVPYAVYLTLSKRKTSYAWAVFVWIHSNFSQVCHTISIWLTVTLAVWRYIMVAMHVKCKTLCTMDRAKWAIASAYVISPLLCIPIYLSFSITPMKFPTPTPSPATVTTSFSAVPKNANSTTTTQYLLDAIFAATTSATFMDNPENYSAVDMGTTTHNLTAGATDPQYIVNLSELAKEYPLLMKLNFWLYSVVIKIIPCILLTVVSLRLINSLMQAKKRKEMLLKKRTSGPALVAGNQGNGGVNPTSSHNDHESSGSDRTTKMLLAVLLLFLITEFPQGMLGLLSGLLGDNFFRTCYIPLADLMDFVALLNSAINFILYCAMSKKFRDTFSELFKLNRLMKLLRRQRGGSRGRVHTTKKAVVPILTNENSNHSPNAIQVVGNSQV